MSTNFLSNQNLLKQQRGAEFNKATSSYLGTVRPDGTTILVNSSGTISVVPVTTATTSATGTVRPDNTSITVSDGVLSLGSSITANWTIQQSSNGSLYFYHAGVAKFRLGTDGVFSATSNIGAFVTI